MKKRNKSDSSPSAAGLDDHGLAKAGYPLPEIFIFSSGFVKERRYYITGTRAGRIIKAIE